MSSCEISLYIVDQHFDFDVEFDYTEHDDSIALTSIEVQTDDGNKNADFLMFTNAASIELAIRESVYDGC